MVLKGDSITDRRRQSQYPQPLFKLEDLKVLKCSPDLLNNVKIGQGQLQLIMRHICFTIYGGCSDFGHVS